MDNCGVYDRLIPMLTKNHSFLTFDLPGHGQSSRYAPGMNYSYYAIIILIERIRKAYKWPKVSLMAHSVGSMISFYYSAIYPEKTDLLICLDNFTPDLTDVVIRNRTDLEYFFDCEDKQQAGRETEPPSYGYRGLVDRLVRGSLDSVGRKYADYLLPRGVNRSSQYPDKYYFNYDRRIRGFACPSGTAEERMIVIQNISCPVLYLIGTDSWMRITAMIPSLEDISEMKKNFYYHFGPGNHHFLLSHPEAYKEVILEFLRKVPPSKSNL